MSQIPSEFQGLFWSRRLRSLNLEKDKTYIIHQVLAYGDLKQIKWLFSIYSKKEIMQVFLVSPKKNYTPQAFNFVKNFILDLEDKKVSPISYVKTLF